MLGSIPYAAKQESRARRYFHHFFPGGFDAFNLYKNMDKQ